MHQVISHEVMSFKIEVSKKMETTVPVGKHGSQGVRPQWAEVVMATVKVARQVVTRDEIIINLRSCGLPLLWQSLYQSRALVRAKEQR